MQTVLSPRGLRSVALSTWGWLARAARSSRVLAALTALVFAASSLAGMAHEAATRHVHCAEHGELVDAASPAPVVLPAVEDSDGPALRDSAPIATLHGHEHCALTSSTRVSRVDLRPPSVAPIALAIAELPDALPARPAHAGDALLLDAPKTSPPVRAA